MLQALIYSYNKKGYTNFTDFVFESRSLSNTSIQKYLWFISDGTLYYNTPKIHHKFNNSGTYTVRLTIWDEDNKQQTSSVTVQVQQYLSDTIFFKHIPKYFPGPGSKTDKPFTVSFTTTITGRAPVISLYADNSRSIPSNASILPTWKDLIPTWRFYDLSGNNVTQLTATNYTPVYYDSSLIGYKGTVDFYFVEDIGINDPFLEQPTVIFATLQTTTQESDILNSTQNTIQKATFWYTDKPIPTDIKITETTIGDIYPTKWSGVKVPYLYTLKTQNNKGYKIDKNSLSSIQFYPFNLLKVNNDNFSFSFPDKSVTSNPIIRTVTNTFNLLPSAYTETQQTSSARIQAISSIDPDYTLTYPTTGTITINFYIRDYIVDYRFPDENIVFTKQDDQGRPTAGFVFDSVYITPLSSRNVTLSASLYIPASSYTPSFFKQNNLIVINPEIGLINDVYSLPHTSKNITHNRLIYDKTLETEYIESNDLTTTFSKITAFPKPTNLYSIATNPTDNTFWATDPDTCHIYKFTSDYTFLTAVNFVSFFDTDDRYPNAKNPPSNRYTPLHIKQDGDQNLWIGFYNSFILVKIDKHGNFLTKTNYTFIDKDAPITTDKIKERNLSVYSLLDVDSKNNVWATHTDFLFNEIRKYDTTGTLLSSFILPTLYNPTSLHIDKSDKIWLTTALTPYLFKPSQDRYGMYWDWFNLKETKNTPLKWKDTRFVGLTNTVVEQEIYPPGKYPKTWNRETYNGQALKTNYAFTITYSSCITPISSLSAVMLNVTAVDINYTLQMLKVSSITVPTLSTFVATFPVSSLNVFYDSQTLTINPPVTAIVNIKIPSNTNPVYYPGLYDTETNYITAGRRIIIEVPKQRAVYNHLPGIQNYGTTLLQTDSAIISFPATSASDVARITAVVPDYSRRFLTDPSRVLYTFRPTIVVPVRASKYPVSALPIQNIISGYEKGMFFRVYNFDYYTQNVYSLANNFTQYTDYRYDTIVANSGIKVSTNLYASPLYTSENDLITDQLSSIYDPITSVRQVIPTNYGNLYCISSGGNILKHYSRTFERPENITSDKNNNIWFTHNYNHFSVLDPNTDTFKTWSLDTDTDYVFTTTKLLTSKLEPNDTVDQDKVFNGNIRGLHVDLFNRVWIVSNNKQKTYMFYAPNLTKNYRKYNANLLNDRNEKHRLTQSFGDPTGSIWFNRYILPQIQNTLYYVLTGQSNPFTVQPLENKHYFRVKNESFDAKEQIKAYALPEVLNRNTVLFDELFGSILGDVSDNRENIGRLIYEKIANFSQYHNDIDTANIEALYSFGQMLGVDVEKGLSKLEYPAEIKRILNFASIPYKKLFGYTNNNIDFKNSYLEPINTNYSFVTAGEVLLINKPQTRQLTTYTVPATTNAIGAFLPDTTPIPYAALTIPVLQNYMYDNYEVYRITPTYINQLTSSFIDWSSNYTKLASGVTERDWYKDGGVIEEMFNYILTKNLLT